MRDHILSACVYLYYYDRALCLDLVFELLLQFYHERNLHRIDDYQLNIEYATGVCYCCQLKSTVAKWELKSSAFPLKSVTNLFSWNKGGIRYFLLFKRRLSKDQYALTIFLTLASFIVIRVYTSFVLTCFLRSSTVPEVRYREKSLIQVKTCKYCFYNALQQQYLIPLVSTLKQGFPRTASIRSIRVILFEVSCKSFSRKSLSLIEIENCLGGVYLVQRS